MWRLSGWMPTAIRGEQSPADLVLSVAVRELEEDSFIFALCQDHKLRMWSFRVRPHFNISHTGEAQAQTNTASKNPHSRSRRVCWRLTCWSTCRPVKE